VLDTISWSESRSVFSITCFLIFLPPVIEFVLCSLLGQRTSEGIQDTSWRIFLECGGKPGATPICSQLLLSPSTNLAIPQSYPHA
jgi:hypothetical protein